MSITPTYCIVLNQVKEIVDKTHRYRSCDLLLCHNFHGSAPQQQAIFGQDNAMLPSVKQLAAQLGFRLRQLPWQGGLCDMQQ